MIRVLVVDDSIVFRSQISACLAEVPGVEVVGAAPNGRIALQKIEQQSVDLVTLDMEMPEMDGLSTLKEIQQKGLKVKSIVFSSQTQRGAEKALEALRLGATDVVAKPSGDQMNFELAKEAIKELLVPKVLQFVDPKLLRLRKESAQPGDVLSKPNTMISPTKPKRSLDQLKIDLCLVASSTGGPNALEEIFRGLKGGLNKPMFIAQHMPPVFTKILAQRLSEVSGIEVREAESGELVRGGVVRVAPGDYHLRIQKEGGGFRVHLDQGPLRNSVRPAADFLFESGLECSPSSILAIVLTGMGEDGKVGAKKLRDAGTPVVIQSRESCVVFGMPGALFEIDEFDLIQDLAGISKLIARKIGDQ